MNVEDQRPEVQAEKPIDWLSVRRVLVIRLRSIGDTVLSTPSLIALRRFLPNARVDVLLEDWVAPVLEGFDDVDSVITVGSGGLDRLKTAWKLRSYNYDVVFNLHGGTTSTMLARATRAKHRIGYSNYQYSFLYNHLLTSSTDFWRHEKTHSAEQQLALLGFVRVPVEDRPKSRLTVSRERGEEIDQLLHVHGIDEEQIALIHPTTAFQTKQWSPQNYARVVEYLESQRITPVVVTSTDEKNIVDEIAASTKKAFHAFTNLTLPEVAALAARSVLFVGNDSGIAHIAAAVKTPTVVIFGSSNRDHWRPWTDAPNEIVFNPFDCQPCPGYECKVYGEPKCILSVTSDQVIAAVDRVLASKEKGEPEPAF